MLFAVALSTAVAVKTPDQCRETFEANFEAGPCIAYLRLSACNAEAAATLPDYFVRALQAEQDRIMKDRIPQGCAESIERRDIQEPPRMETDGGNLDFIVDNDNDMAFVRTRREVVHIWDVVEDVQEIKGSQSSITADIDSGSSTLTDAVERVGAEEEATSIIFSDLDTKVSQAGLAAAVSTLTSTVNQHQEAQEDRENKMNECLKDTAYYNGTECVEFPGMEDNLNIKVECDPDYSVNGVCVTSFHTSRMNYATATQKCQSDPYSRMCSSAEVQHIGFSGVFRYNQAWRDFIWVRGAEGQDNQEFPGVSNLNSQDDIRTDDWNRNSNSGTVLCCRERHYDIGCKNGKAHTDEDGNMVACETYFKGYDSDRFREALELCYGRGNRLCTSAESAFMCNEGTWCGGDDWCWIDGGEGNSNQYNQVREGNTNNCRVDDRYRHSHERTQCCQNFLAPVTAAECRAGPGGRGGNGGTGGKVAGNVCLWSWDRDRSNYLNSVKGCAADGGRMCYMDELYALTMDRTAGNVLQQALGSQNVWLDGGEGNDSHQESVFSTNGRHPDDNDRNSDIARACCRRIGEEPQ